MKKVLVLVMTLFAVSGVFASEGKDNKGGDREGRRHEMMSQLNLTDAQKTQMKALREKHMAERQAMQEKHKSEIKAIMNAEQWEKFQQMMPKRPGMEGGKMGGKGMRRDRDDEGEGRE